MTNRHKLSTTKQSLNKIYKYVQKSQEGNMGKLGNPDMGRSEPTYRFNPSGFLI